ncbi:MAG TPA: 30S ribosomal protein S12 methylthiotransferase RimO [Mycobacteriales bacterium]|nr:30S ribosomal protein S12 methylthiotransferase RimO [Mycobacteriales bacterium]
MSRSVALVTLGCGRNEVDSEELAARLEADGWTLTDDAGSADAVLVNTCGFIEAAKRDSIDTLLDAAEGGRRVVAVGCLAERYGEGLANELPEVAVLGFDDYAQIGDRLDDIVAGRRHRSHRPRDRRALLPLTPVERAAHAVEVGIPGHAGGPRAVLRRRLSGDPVAPLKLASGCDRRCAFCAIPSFRGAFVSRRPDDIVAEAEWLADHGVRELVLVSENSTSYGKDFGDLQALERLLPRLAAVPGVVRVRVSYLQPAEVRPSLLDVMAATPEVAAYFDVSFQHAAEPLLRRMRRFGGTDRFLELIAAVRERVPAAGIRSNFILGFPGETPADVDELERFLSAARLDAVGVFGYSDEEGTEAAGLDGKLADGEIAARVERMTSLAEELIAQRAEDRIGEPVSVLVESVGPDGVEGRAEHQAPEVDGSVRLRGPRTIAVGDLVGAVVVAADGVDLVAEVGASGS